MVEKSRSVVRHKSSCKARVSIAEMGLDIGLYGGHIDAHEIKKNRKRCNYQLAEGDGQAGHSRTQES